MPGSTGLATGVQLDVYSDVICPWCHLGHRRLQAAIGRVGGDAIERVGGGGTAPGKAASDEAGPAGIDLRWRAFQLDPHAPAEPGDLSRAIEARYGPGAFDAMSRRLVALGAEAGIDYRFDLARRVNTFDAHRLIQWAAASRPELTGALVDRLFRAYFTEGANVADHATLVALGTDVGLDGTDVAVALASGAGADRVRADRAEAMEIGITGVPAVVYNGATIIPGAQDVDTMARVLARLRAKVG